MSDRVGAKRLGSVYFAGSNPSQFGNSMKRTASVFVLFLAGLLVGFLLCRFGLAHPANEDVALRFNQKPS